MQFIELTPNLYLLRIPKNWSRFNDKKWSFFTIILSKYR